MTDKITEQKISFSDMVGQLMGNGIEQDGMKDMGEYIKDIFYKEFADVKPLFIEIIILLISFSLLTQLFANREKYISSMSFFVVYGMLMILLMQSFVLLCKKLSRVFTDISASFAMSVISISFSSTYICTFPRKHSIQFSLLDFSFRLNFFKEFSLGFGFLMGAVYDVFKKYNWSRMER